MRPDFQRVHDDRSGDGKLYGTVRPGIRNRYRGTSGEFGFKTRKFKAVEGRWMLISVRLLGRVDAGSCVSAEIIIFAVAAGHGERAEDLFQAAREGIYGRGISGHEKI